MTTKRPLFLDLTRVSCGCVDHALEELHKAISDDPAMADRVWNRHENPWIADHVEEVTSRGIEILDKIRGALLDRLVDPRTKEQGKRQGLFKAMGWTRFTQEEFEAIARHLDSKPQSEYTLEDWMMVVDLIIHQYLPADVIRTEAEYLAVRASIAGKVQAQMQDRSATPEVIAVTMAATPSTFAEAAALGLSAAEQATIEMAMARAAMFITDIGDRTRQRIKHLIVNHETAKAYGEREATNWKLQQKLLDEFGILNRDWRRVVVTETGEDANLGFIASLDPGARVRRVEAYEGACPFCRKIHGMEFAVVSSDTEGKDGWSEVWVGKNNVGRSASPRKRVGDELVERLDAELWWPASGVQHPNCFISPHVAVYTSSGWKPISRIAVGDDVLTHKGRFRKVNWVLEPDKSYSGKVIRLRASFGGKNVAQTPSMTPEHPVLTVRGWVAAGNLVCSDRVVALAKVCPTCGEAFVNPKHDHVAYCSVRCAPKTGKNQFSTDNPDEYAKAVSVTRDANTQRMRGMTIEQRRMLTAAARSGEYVFEYLVVEQVIHMEVRNKRLYNFGVDEDESYIVRGGVVVHNCRGGWALVDQRPPDVEPEFEAHLDEVFKRGSK